MADAFEMAEHRHTGIVLDAGHQALAAPRHNEIDGATEAFEHYADAVAIGGGHHLDRCFRQAGAGQATPQAGGDGR